MFLFLIVLLNFALYIINVISTLLMLLIVCKLKSITSYFLEASVILFYLQQFCLASVCIIYLFFFHFPYALNLFPIKDYSF